MGRVHVFVGVLALLSVSSHGCIFKYGTSPDTLAPPKGGTPWDHGFQGDDWNGTDAAGRPWTCLTGIRQSPISVPSAGTLDDQNQEIPFKLRTTWSYPALASNGSNIEVINTGHTIQVEWLFPYTANVQISVPASPNSTTPITAVLSMRSTDSSSTVRAVPLQFHFHTNSEHTVSGKYYPLELHIVHRVTDLPSCATAGGCFSVTGILFKLVDGPDNPLLDAIWAAIPEREGTINFLPAGAQILLNDLLPPPNKRDYVTYEGSLTTPPCSEGLLWHVFYRPQRISVAQWTKYQRAVGLKTCTFTNGTAAVPGSSATAGRHLLQSVAGRQAGQQQQPQPAHRHSHLLDRQLGSLQQGNPNDFVCKVTAYGFNFRVPQRTNSRIVKLAKASSSLLDGVLGLGC